MKRKLDAGVNPSNLARRDSHTVEKEFRAKVMELGGQVKGVYQPCKRIACVCPKGHDTLISANKLVATSKQLHCKTCTQDANRIDEQEFLKHISNAGGVIIGQFVSKYLKVHCRCSQGHDCYPWLSAIRTTGKICTLCPTDSTDKSKKQFELFIQRLQFTMLEPYTNSRVKVKCQCPAGHICFLRPTNIQQGGPSDCRECRKDQKNTKIAHKDLTLVQSRV